MLLFFLGIIVGGVLYYVWSLPQKKATQLELSLLKKYREEIDQSLQSYKEQLKGVSSEALKESQQAFFGLAKTTFEGYQKEAKGEFDKKELSLQGVLKPLKESLEKVDGKINDLEKVRVGAYASLKQQIEGLLEAQKNLSQEARILSNVLKAPQSRGQWGEMQLKRVVEMAGMMEHCDFYTQEHRATEDGAIRPDVIVKLPSNRSLIIDAKAPMQAYLEGMESDQESVRKQKLKEHARFLRSHILQLSRKSYWEQFESSPEFVILFLPGETFFSAALQEDPSLIEEGVKQKVILATPTTLIALLRAVSYGWRQEQISVNAQKISQLGRELYKRVSDVAAHWAKMGKHLDQAVHSYNKAVGSMETRLLVSARRFLDLEMTGENEIEPLEPLDQVARAVQAEELIMKEK
jgi:DNA recombination protein RmuC